MVEHERFRRRRVTDEPPVDEQTRAAHPVLALQQAMGNQAVGRMLARQHDPDFAYGPGTAEAIVVEDQDDMDKAVEELIDDRYGGYRALFEQNTIATSVSQWTDLIFSYMEETYDLRNGMKKPNVRAAVMAVKDKYRSESLLNAARVHVYWQLAEDDWIASADDLADRMRTAGVYLDDEDEDAVQRMYETSGEYAQSKVEVAGVDIELLDEDDVVVVLDHHQQKHQKTKIPAFGTYKGKRGSKFAIGKDLEWHRGHTALVVKETIETARDQGLVTKDGESYLPSKQTPIDGIVYDLTISFDSATGKFVGSYHCNPLQDEVGDDSDEED